MSRAAQAWPTERMQARPTIPSQHCQPAPSTQPVGVLVGAHPDMEGPRRNNAGRPQRVGQARGEAQLAQLAANAAEQPAYHRI